MFPLPVNTPFLPFLNVLRVGCSSLSPFVSVEDRQFFEPSFVLCFDFLKLLSVFLARKANFHLVSFPGWASALFQVNFPGSRSDPPFFPPPLGPPVWLSKVPFFLETPTPHGNSLGNAMRPSLATLRFKIPRPTGCGPPPFLPGASET